MTSTMVFFVFVCLTPSVSVCRWHYSCTARMGPEDGPVDQFACDPQLRVRGVSGLRVADCSVAPFVVSVSMAVAVFSLPVESELVQCHGPCLTHSFKRRLTQTLVP